MMHLMQYARVSLTNVGYQGFAFFPASGSKAREEPSVLLILPAQP
jgi:hypothetical protein